MKKSLRTAALAAIVLVSSAHMFAAPTGCNPHPARPTGSKPSVLVSLSVAASAILSVFGV